MGVNEGPYPDNWSQCSECGEWAEDQVLTRLADGALLCRDCVLDRGDE